MVTKHFVRSFYDFVRFTLPPCFANLLISSSDDNLNASDVVVILAIRHISASTEV